MAFGTLLALVGLGSQPRESDMKYLRCALLVVGMLALLSFQSLDGAEPAKAVGPDAKEWNATVDAAIAYLKSRQAEDGTWSKATSPAVTGLVVTGLLRSGKVKADDPMVASALKFLETLVDPKEGHIAGKGSKLNTHNYATSVNILAFQAAGQGKYKAVIDNATAYLKKLQWDESEGKKPQDTVYGGAGYGGGSRPDLSNTSFYLEALKTAGVRSSDPAFQKALVYVSRCQNLRSEHNDQPWADKINDGSFIYGASLAGETRGDPGKDGAKPGYGSMTYSGLKCMLYCGLNKKDKRCQKALEWIEKHYTVDENPGMPIGGEGRGLYYYLAAMARCLDTLGVDEVVDAAGKKHDWRADITAALKKRQKKDGSWANETTNWMEANPDLCTAYALIALSHCKPASGRSRFATSAWRNASGRGEAGRRQRLQGAGIALSYRVERAEVPHADAGWRGDGRAGRGWGEARRHLRRRAELRQLHRQGPRRRGVAVAALHRGLWHGAAPGNSVPDAVADRSE
jgi:squalene-hopene/tetraprenyl-beta-curcumene cyclase